MKRLLFLFLILPALAQAQNTPVAGAANQTPQYLGGQIVNKVFIAPANDTSTANLVLNRAGMRKEGAIVYQSPNWYYHDGAKWIQWQGGGGVGTADGNNYPTSISFNAGDGTISIARVGLTTINSGSLDSRYVSNARLSDSLNQIRQSIPASVTSLPYESITGKPNTFPPSPHTHAVGDLTQTGALTGQVIKWDGMKWAPGTDLSAIGGGTDGNNYTTSVTFNTATGNLSTMRDGLATLTTNLDGRYLQSFTESDPIFIASPSFSITNTNKNNWNDAYSWGNHAGLYPLLSGSYTNPAWITSLAASKVTGLATVAITSSYNDLSDRPIIPAVTGTNTGDQSLSLNNRDLSISGANGNTVTLPGETFTTAEKNKLAGIVPGATANSTDAELRDRSTHTGTQSAATITGLATVATTGDYNDLFNKPVTDSIPTTIALLKGDGTGGAVAAVSGTDYLTPAQAVLVGGNSGISPLTFGTNDANAAIIETNGVQRFGATGGGMFKFYTMPPEYASENAATTGGMATGEVFHTGGVLRYVTGAGGSGGIGGGGGSTFWTQLQKTSDQSNSTTTNADLTDLTFPVINGKLYHVRAMIAYTGSVAPGFGNANGGVFSGAAGYGRVMTRSGNAASLVTNSPNVVSLTAAATGIGTINVDLTFRANATGTFAFQFTSTTAGTAVTFLAGSFLEYHEY